MSVLAERDELLVGGRRGMEYDKDMIVDRIIADLLSKGVYPPIFHRFRGIGLYVVRLFVEFQWVYVILDERVPVDAKTRKPIFGRCRSVHEMWVALIEKAFAKLYGCYENLISGYVDEGVNHLTAFPSEKIFIKNEHTGVFPHKTVAQHYGGAEGLWQLLKERDNEGCLMGCSIKGEQGGPLVLNGKDSGLIQNHAYSLNDIVEIADPFNKGQFLRLLRLRNPWGKSEWLGAWAANSEEMTRYQPHIQAYIDTLPPDEQFDMEADDGIFFIHYDDWKDNFTSLFVNVDFPASWTGLRFRSKWTKSNAGGLPKRYEQDQLERFAKNP
jgi:calpain